MAKFVKDNFTIVPNKKEALKLRGAELNVYLAICGFADGKGGCFPSIATIAECTGYSRDAVKVALKELGTKRSLISIEARTRENGSITSNYYQILIDDGGLGDYTHLGGGVHTPTITKPINLVDKSTTHQKQKEEDLLSLVNKITGRNFRVFGTKSGVKRTLDTFSLEEIESALTALAHDPWHQPKLKELSVDYFIRSTTIDRFLGVVSDLGGKSPSTYGFKNGQKIFTEDEKGNKYWGGELITPENQDQVLKERMAD